MHDARTCLRIFILMDVCRDLIFSLFFSSDVMLNKNGPSKGLIIVFDQQHMGMRHLMRPTVDGLMAYFKFLQEALPIKLERMFIMNAVSYFDMVLRLIKPFMKSEILQKV